MSSGQDSSTPPSFSRSHMPMNVQPGGIDDMGEETTRRVAFQPSFQPSFEPMSSFQMPPMISETKQAAATKPVAPTKSAATTQLISKTARGLWKLNEVPVLPEFHPLERTAVFVPNSSPSEVSMRVSDMLRERSIEATYEDKKGKARCLSSDGVDFRVRLYRGRKQFGHGIIVEVQRRFGSSATFYKDTMAILDAAEGKVPPPPPPCGMPLVSDGDDDDSSSVDGVSSLKMVEGMLNNKGYDAHYLGLQMLASMTDSSKIGKVTARKVSSELLRFDGDNDVGCKVLSLVIDKKGDEDVFKLRSMAFKIIANAFQTVRGNVPLILKEQLRFVVIDELRLAEKTPRIALQAARIVEFFVPQDTGSDLHNALETALSAGASRHAALQRQAQLCLDKLV